MLEEAQRVSVYDMNGRLLYDDKTSFLDVNQLGHFGLKLVRIQDVIFKTL
jgi:hypothetical protein